MVAASNLISGVQWEILGDHKTLLDSKDDPNGRAVWSFVFGATARLGLTRPQGRPYLPFKARPPSKGARLRRRRIVVAASRGGVRLGRLGGSMAKGPARVGREPLLRPFCDDTAVGRRARAEGV